jgi:hypothetical protein
MLRPLMLALTTAAAVTPQCGSSSSSTPGTTSILNFQTIVVNAGPANTYFNGAFTTVTICVPGQSTCQTIDGVLIDTGSSGLRVLASSVTLSLPQQTDRLVDRGMRAVPGWVHLGPSRYRRRSVGRRTGECRADPGDRRGRIRERAGRMRELGRGREHARRARRERHPGHRPVPPGLRDGVHRHGIVESGVLLHVPEFRVPERGPAADPAAAESGVALRD